MNKNVRLSLHLIILFGFLAILGPTILLNQASPLSAAASFLQQENNGPTADAGPDQIVQEGNTVQLDGTASEGRTSIIES